MSAFPFSKEVRGMFLALTLVVLPLSATSLAQNNNVNNPASQSNTQTTTTQTNRPVQTTRTETRQERDIDIPWGLLGLLGLAGLLKRPKKVTETVVQRETEVRDVRTEPVRERMDTNQPGNRL